MFCDVFTRPLATSLLLILALAACSDRQKPEIAPSGFGFFKSPEAQEACLSSNLSQWELSGTFLHKFLRCASNTQENGGETLQGSMQLLSALRPDQLQTLVDFLLLTDPRGASQEERYPYLLAFTSLLDRGLTLSTEQGLNLSGERLDDLQGLLLSFQPDRVQTILSHWARSGRLEPLMAEVGRFLEALETDHLEALSYEILAGRTLRPEFLSISREILRDESLMRAVEKSLDGSATRRFEPEEQDRLLEQWRQPLQAGDLPPAPRVAAEKPGPTPAQGLQSLSQALGPRDLDRVSRMLLSLWDAYRGLTPQDQRSVQRRLTSGPESSLAQQRHPSLWLLSIARDLERLQASDLNEVANVFERLLSGSNDLAMNGLRNKIGANRLMENMVELLAQGGRVPGCTDLSLDGLGRAIPQDFASIQRTLLLVTSPHPACGNQAPLDRALAAWLDASPNPTCPEDSVSCPSVPGSLPLETHSHDWQASPEGEPEWKLVERLLESSLAELRVLVSQDPYALRNLGLATEPVTTRDIDALWGRIRQAKLEDLEGLARLDRQLAEDPRLRTRFPTDLLETIVARHLEKLAAQAYHFRDLVPEQPEQQSSQLTARALRIFAGIYPGGPMEQAVRQRLTEGRLAELSWSDEPKLAAMFRDRPSLRSAFLSRYHANEAVFQDPEFDSQFLGSSSAIVTQALGVDPNSAVTFSAQVLSPADDPRYTFTSSAKVAAAVPRPTQAFQAAKNKGAAWGLWQVPNGGKQLLSKDIPAEQTAAFQGWIEGPWAELLSSPETWQDIRSPVEPDWAQEAYPLSREFFDIPSEYSPTEARMLALFYLRHYTKWPHILPAQRTIREDNDTTGMLPARGFFNAGVLVRRVPLPNESPDYPLFTRLFPPQLRIEDGGRESLEELQKRLLPPYSSFVTNKQLFKIEALPQIQSNLQQALDNLLKEREESAFGLLSSFDLMSYTMASRRYTLQPLVGFGQQLCRRSSEETTACPVEIQAPSEEEAYTAYQEYLSEVVAHHFCPLIDGQGFGDPLLWQKRLGLAPNSAETCKKIRKVEQLPADDLAAVRFPMWLSERILHDIFTMGREPRLKAGLQQIPAILRFHKLKMEETNSQVFAQRWLRESTGVWNARNAASQHRRQMYARQFWAGQPSLLNSYLDFVTQENPSTREGWQQALVQYARENSDQDPLNALMQRFVEEQRHHAAAGDSLLELGFSLLQQLEQHPAERRVLARLLSDYRQLENYGFLGNELHLIPGLFESFDWQDPTLRLLKHAVQRETIQAWSQWSVLFSAEDWDGFFSHAAKATAALGSLAEQEAITRQLLSHTVALGSLWQESHSQVLAQSWDEVLHVWRHANYSAGLEAAWSRMLELWDSPLELFAGRPGPSLQRLLEAGLPRALEHLPNVLVAHQNTGSLREQLLWSRAFLDGLETLAREPAGSRALASFLGSPDLDVWNGPHWERLLLDERARALTSQTLQVMSAVQESFWQAAVTEMNELLGRFEKPLSYLRERLVWRRDGPDNTYRKVLDRLQTVSRDPDLRQRQSEVLSLWLQDDPLQPADEP